MKLTISLIAFPNNNDPKWNYVKVIAECVKNLEFSIR